MGQLGPGEWVDHIRRRWMEEMQDYRDGFMSVLFLQCDDISKEFPDCPPCCSHCHTDANKATHKIYVRPIGKDGLNADWYLCVEAIVCCNRYHFVRTLPYEWWEQKSVEFKVKRDDMRGYIYPSNPERNTERTHVASSKTPSIQAFKKEKAKREISRQQEEEEAGGLGGFLRR